MPKLQYLAAQPSGRRFPPVQTFGLFRADCPDKDKLPPFCATSLHSNSCAATSARDLFTSSRLCLLDGRSAVSVSVIRTNLDLVLGIGNSR